MKAHNFVYDMAVELADSFATAGISDHDNTLVQVYTTSPKRNHIEAILNEIRSILPSAVIVGATTSASVFNGEIREDATVISVCQFDTTLVSVAHAICDANDAGDFRELGRELAELPSDADTRLLFCYAACPRLNAEELAKGLTDNLQDIVLTGCLATGPRSGTEAFVMLETEILSSAIVLVALSGEELFADLVHSSDWMMLGTTMEITAAEGNLVETINDRPARDIYARYLGEEACREFATTCIRFPMLTERDGTIVARLARDAHADGSIESWGNIYPGESVRFGIPSPAAAMEDFNGMLEKLQEQPCDALFVFPSQVRMYLMRSLTQDEISQLQSHAPTTGMFTLGQFFYLPGQGSYLHYAETTLAITEDPDKDRDPSSYTIQNPFSQDTLEMRAVSRLVTTTARELEEANRSLEKLANTDALTGIYNRHKGQLQLEQEFRRAQRYGRPLSLIMMDLDNFKRINDSYGHHIGDEALIHVANSIAPLIRETDYFARWGGEEFLIICPETEITGTSELAERLRIAVAAKPAIHDVTVTLSIGVTAYHAEDTQEKLLSRVDQALYLSKKQGKNRVTTWD